jgi:hypothetical protein
MSVQREARMIHLKSHSIRYNHKKNLCQTTGNEIMQCLADIQIADPTITSGVIAGRGTLSVPHPTHMGNNHSGKTNLDSVVAAAIKHCTF